MELNTFDGTPEDIERRLQNLGPKEQDRNDRLSDWYLIRNMEPTDGPMRDKQTVKTTTKLFGKADTTNYHYGAYPVTGCPPEIVCHDAPQPPHKYSKG